MSLPTCKQVGWIDSQFSIFESRVDILHAENVKNWKEYTGLDEDEMPLLLRLKWDATFDDVLSAQKIRRDFAAMNSIDNAGLIKPDVGYPITFDKYFEHHMRQLKHDASGENCPLMVPREFVMIFVCDLPAKNDRGYAFCEYNPEIIKDDREKGTSSPYGYTVPSGIPGSKKSFPGSPCHTPCERSSAFAYRTCTASGTRGGLAQSQSRFENQYCEPCHTHKVKFYFNLFHLMRMVCVGNRKKEDLIDSLRNKQTELESRKASAMAGVRQDEQKKALLKAVTSRRKTIRGEVQQQINKTAEINEKFQKSRLQQSFDDELESLEKNKRAAEQMTPTILNPITQAPFESRELATITQKYTQIKNKWIEDVLVQSERNTFQRFVVPIIKKTGMGLGTAAAVASVAGLSVVSAGIGPIILGVLGLVVWTVTLFAEMENIYQREQLIKGEKTSAESFQLGWDICVGGICTAITAVSSTNLFATGLNEADVKTLIADIQAYGEHGVNAITQAYRQTALFPTQAVDSVVGKTVKEILTAHGQEDHQADEKAKLIQILIMMGYHYHIKEVALAMQNDKVNLEPYERNKKYERITQFLPHEQELTQNLTQVMKGLQNNGDLYNHFSKNTNDLVRTADALFVLDFPLHEDFIQHPTSLKILQDRGYASEQEVTKVTAEVQALIEQTSDRVKQADPPTDKRKAAFAQ